MYIISINVFDNSFPMVVQPKGSDDLTTQYINTIHPSTETEKRKAEAFAGVPNIVSKTKGRPPANKQEELIVPYEYTIIHGHSPVSE